MKACHRSAVACLLISLVTSSVYAQGPAPRSADEVTDAQVAMVQANMETGCVKRGLERKHPDDKELHDGCACTVAVARAQITKPEWQQLVMDAVTNNGQDAQATMAKHKDAMQVCWPKP